MTCTDGNHQWIGVDLAKDSFDAAIAPEDIAPTQWRRLSVEHFENTPEGRRAFSAWIQRQGDLRQCRRIVVESTGSLARRFADDIGGKGLPPVAVVNPARPRHFGRSLGVRDKSDRVDAAILAVYGATHRPEATPERSPTHQRLRDLSRLREDLVADRTAWSNRLGESLDRFADQMIKRRLRQIDAEIARVEEEIDRLIENDEMLLTHRRLLLTISGIGPVCAHTLLAELGDLSQWGRGEIVSQAGLFAREHTSGTSVRRRPRLARGGGGRLRRVLYLGATSLLSREGPLAEWARRLVARGKSKMAAIGAMMRKLLLIARAVIRSRRPFDPALVGGREMP